MRKSKISLALLAAMAIQAPITSYAFAEEETAPEAQTAKEKAEAKEQAIKEDEIEVITVGGMRSSEVAAINMKKFADTISDNLSAEEVGALPDQSIAESLERLTGVTGNQDNGRSNTISVRGMGGAYTLTTLNDREIVSSFGSRSVNLSLFPSASIRKAQVYKTARADALEGGISGHVNMETFKPLEVNRNIRTLSGTINTNDLHDDLTSNEDHSLLKELTDSDKYGRHFSGLISQHLNDNLAVSVGGSYRDDTRFIEGIKNAAVLQNLGWTTDWNGDGVNDEIANPASTLSSKIFDEKQTAVFGALQYAPNDDLLISIDYLTSKYEYEMDQAVMSHWGLTSGISHVDPALADINPDNHYVMSGISSVNSIGKWETNALNEDETEVFGVNVKYDITDDLRINFDIAKSTADRVWGWRTGNGKYGANMNHYLEWDHYNDEYGFSYLGSDTDGSAFNPETYELDRSKLTQELNNPDLFTFEKLTNGHNTMDSEVKAVKFDIIMDTDFGIVHQLKFGARYSENTKDFKDDGEVYEAKNSRKSKDGQDWISDEDWANTWAQISDVDFHALNTSLTNNPYQKLDKINGYDEFFYFNPKDILNAKSSLFPERYLDDADKLSSYEIEENTTAVYVQASFAGDWYDGIIGVRYFETELESSSWQSPFYLTPVDENLNEFELIIGDLEWATEKHDYSEVLPTLNVNLRLIDDVVIRIGAGKAVIKPSLGEINSSVDLKDNNFDENAPADSKPLGKAGNPYLDPIVSTQGDISIEYYPTKWDYYSLAGFYKDLDGIYEQGATYIPAEGVTDADGNPLALPVTSEVKADGGHVYGVEFSFRQNLGKFTDYLKGFALSGNYMDFYHDAHQDYNNRSPGDTPLSRPTEIYYQPVGWIDSTYNIALTYDYGKSFSARLNFNQQEYQATRDGQNYAVSWPSENLSLNIKYRVNKYVQFFAQGANLLDETTTKGNLSNDKVGVAHKDFIWEQQHRGVTYYAGVRLNF
ncbi:TonB-dependent receptor [Thalassotalea sp. HSM 43]|uniref:TonB-dependent receptor n=1 Tax=Thalassotalea sp. HSM 43 TaxID=2552945 RepID=UPI0010821E64|nr:TonB-dependent receptor [Thalassotalea sp. HSM 43]QBY04266.1 TonB-dependent receptor [Thalassotalea sp. HSM 43]